MRVPCESPSCCLSWPVGYQPCRDIACYFLLWLVQPDNNLEKASIILPSTQGKPTTDPACSPPTISINNLVHASRLIWVYLASRLGIHLPTE